MGLKIGKFFGRLASGVVKAAPALISSYAGGGLGGFASSGLKILGSNLSQQRAAPAATPQMYNVAANYGGAYGQFPTQAPGSMTVSNDAVMVKGTELSKMPRDVFDAVVALANRLGIPIRSQQRILQVAKLIMSKLLRFARNTPGLTILQLLVSLGLTAELANHLVSWYATSGKRRRRIRVTNVKALNRSVRRLEGFRRLSVRVNNALAMRSSGSRASSYRGRARRCVRCKKNPCCC
jgi:hypothetical protein